MSKKAASDAGDVTPATRFLRSAKLCRIRDLKQLSILSELVGDISGLIHALQKERGASSILLGSHGEQFAQRLAQRSAECRELEQVVRARLEHVDEQLDRMSSGARFYTRVACAFHELDMLPGIREQILALTLAPQDAVKIFSDIIGSLLAVVFEAADIAADPAVSRALVALVNFAQGKEFAGQERATAGAAFSRGHLLATEHQRLQHLVAAQEQAFHIFREFALPPQATALQRLFIGREANELERMRKVVLGNGRANNLAGISGEAWYEQITQRIDAMKTIEEQLNADLKRLCASKLQEVETESDSLERLNHDALAEPAPVAMLVMDADPALNAGLEGVGLYNLEGMKPKPMRSILDVIQAQSRRIHDVRHQLESARSALHERKAVDRAKGLLMSNRKLTEEQAYALMRQTAMNQNKRMVEVAEAIVGMAEILKP
ncbi:MAG: nitrate- and nitrite sensing domain-containing protein [Steroidobacteraceae bacterium]